MSGSELFSHGDQVQWNTPEQQNPITPEMDARLERLLLKKVSYDMEAEFLNLEEDAETVLSMSTPEEIETNVYRSLMHFEEFEEFGANTYEVDFVYNIITGKGVIG